MKQLHIAKNLSLPLDAVTQKIAILGMSGSGKSYAMTKLAEQMLDAQAQVIILDPKGEAWGLRLLKDGKTPGYRIPVFGGEHADVPLNPDMGKRIADLLVRGPYSAILDVSEFISSEIARFGYDFATQFLHLKKQKPGAVSLMIDEAQDFIPQNPQPAAKREENYEPKMLHAFERLQKQGRSKGIGMVIAGQRPQEINKKVLNLSELWITFQLTGLQERTTTVKIIGEKDREIAAAIEEQLPRLEQGRAYFWSPVWLKTSGVYHVLEKKTFDSSATPEVGARQVVPRELSPVEIDELTASLRDVIEEAEKSDPKKQEARLARSAQELRESERERERLQKELNRAQARTVTKEVEVPVIKPAELKRFESSIEKLKRIIDDSTKVEEILSDFFDKFVEARAGVLKEAGQLSELVARAAAPQPAPPAPATAPAPRPQVPTAQPARRTAPSAPDSADGLSPTAQAFLDVLNQYEKRDRVQLALLAGYSPTSGGVYKALAQLRAQSLAEGPESALRITPEGRLRAQPAVIRQGKELLDYWKSHQALTPTAAAFLQALYDAHPRSLSREELAEQCGYSPTSGGVYKALALLRRLELASGQESALSISEEFFA